MFARCVLLVDACLGDQVFAIASSIAVHNAVHEKEMGNERLSHACHALVQLARLLVLSHGETTLTPQRWQELLQLEHAREARLRVM